MNLDLLKKLTRLANNNPNDNEANLAARKVCKMLEAGNWELPALPTYKPEKKVTTWGDVTRSTEPEFRSKYYSEPEAKADADRRQAEWFNEFFRKMTDAERERWKQYREGSWETKRPPPRWNPEDYPFYKEGKKSSAYSNRDKKRMLRCTKCGVDKETGYVGNLYVCTDCYWKDYNQKQEAK